MGDATLVIKRVFNAPIEDVFDAWIDPKRVAQWYGPEGFSNDIHSFEAREGGEYYLTMHAPSGEKHPLRGTFKTIKKPELLVFTWQWENASEMANKGGETEVTVEFKRIGSKTEMTMTHAGFVDKKTKQMHDHGWSSSFAKLAQNVG